MAGISYTRTYKKESNLSQRLTDESLIDETAERQS